MGCYHPIPAAQVGTEAPRLWPPLGTANLALQCGKCIGCRSARAAQTATRAMHEASLHEHNTFITLTYDDDNLPPNGHLDAPALCRFLKRLRKSRDTGRAGLASDRRSSIRYLACGEYGEKGGRPHYHLLAFNAGFTDTRSCGNGVAESDLLRQLWPYGQNRVGTVTAASATYVAQYNLKKQGRFDADSDGVERPAPFLRFSTRPALGVTWVDRYRSDVAKGFITDGSGRKLPVPRRYYLRLKDIDPPLAEELAYRRSQSFITQPSDSQSPERLKAAEIIHKRRKQLSENRSL